MSKRFSKIFVEITNICNLNCHFCSKDKLEKREMSLDEFKIVISKIKDYTDNICLHVKGEPLIHSKLDEILEVCDKNKINVRITTNGCFLYQKLDILLKHNIKQINVSLHSENNIPNYFDMVFKSCDILSKKTTVIYRIWTLKTLKLDKLSTMIVDKINNYYHLADSVIEKINNEKNIKIRENVYIDKECEFTWPKITSKKSETGTCFGTRSHIAILSNGNITPCCLDSSSVIKLGNIFQDELSDVLNSQLFKEINDGFTHNKIVHELCQSCVFRNKFTKE